jgi:hypothetical protein
VNVALLVTVGKRVDVIADPPSVDVTSITMVCILVTVVVKKLVDAPEKGYVSLVAKPSN